MGLAISLQERTRGVIRIYRELAFVLRIKPKIFLIRNLLIHYLSSVLLTNTAEETDGDITDQYLNLTAICNRPSKLWQHFTLTGTIIYWWSDALN